MNHYELVDGCTKSDRTPCTGQRKNQHEMNEMTEDVFKQLMIMNLATIKLQPMKNLPIRLHA